MSLVSHSQMTSTRQPSFRELGLIDGIALDISRQLGVPIGRVRGRALVAQLAAMLMPETAVDEDDAFSTWENQVGGAGKVAAV